MKRSAVVMGLILGASFAAGIAEAGPKSRDVVNVVAADGPDREARQPQAAVGEDGRIFVVFGAGNTIRCAVSADGGRTFEAPATVGSVGALALGMRRGPRIAVTDKAVVVTAVGGKTGKGRDVDLLAWRSTDTGKTWTGPTRINSEEGSAREGLHGMAAGPGGAVFCAWLDLRNDRTELFGARSNDGGATWEPDHLVYRSPDGSICECCHPSVTFSSNRGLLVMWRNQLGGDRDMYLIHSKDGGRTFGTAEKLGQGRWHLDACPMDGGAVAADGPVVATAWMRAGEMFAAVPGRRELMLGRGVQGWTAIGPEGAYYVWLDKRRGHLLGLMPGSEKPVTLADQADDPVVVSSPDGQGPVIAVWETGNDQGRIASMVLAPRTKPE